MRGKRRKINYLSFCVATLSIAPLRDVSPADATRRHGDAQRDRAVPPAAGARRWPAIADKQKHE
jgi:hypothetical protein